MTRNPYLRPYTYRREIGYDFYSDADTKPFLDQYSEERTEEVQTIYRNWEI